MALEAGVWGKAGWLALHSHLEGLLALASVPQHLPSLPPTKVLHSVCGVPASGCHHVCVCQSVTLGCVCVCVHAHACVCLFLTFSFWVRMPLLGLSPATSVPQPEREEMVLDAHCIWAAGPELS